MKEFSRFSNGVSSLDTVDYPGLPFGEQFEKLIDETIGHDTTIPHTKIDVFLI
jgi:hypothetical protein